MIFIKKFVKGMAKNLPIRVKYGIIGALLNYMRSTIMHKNRMRAKNRGGGGGYLS